MVGAGGTEEWALTAPAAIETTASTRRWRNLLDNIGIGGAAHVRQIRDQRGRTQYEKSAFAQRTRNRNAVVLFPNQLLKHLLILRPELMAVLHHRVTPPVVQLVQHPREATALLVGLGKQLQLLTAVLDVGEAHTHQA